MRILIFLTSIFVFALSLNGQKAVDLRVVETGLNLNSEIMKVEIQVKKTDRSELVLGGYNMRLYYNSEKLDLIEKNVQSLLSNTKYTNINIDNHLRDVNVTGYGKIPYSDNLSFISFSSNLKSLSTEGQRLESMDEWVSIASLDFRVMESFKDEEVITLAREDRTDSYATAFIEMTEWIGPREIKALKVNEYTEEIKGFDEANKEYLNIVVGPNPASNDLNIEFSKEIAGNDYQVIIRDVTGAQVITRRIDQGSTNIMVDIRNLLSANYLVEVLNDDEVVKTKKIIKIN